MSATETISSPPSSVAAATILIVEDTPFWQKQIEQAVQGAGFASLLAGDGIEALSLLKSHKPDLIVSDIEMPRLSGLDLMKALRSLPTFQQIPIILLTTAAAKDRIVQATRFHAAEYMLKGSFSGDHLVERIKKWLNRAEASSSPHPGTVENKPAARTIPRLLQRAETLKGVIAQTARGKTLAGVLPHLKELCGVPGNLSAITEIIKHDPILAMRILHQANSSKRVGTIEDAVKMVGEKGIGPILESLESYSAGARSAAATWAHSVAVASVMHKIVPRSFEVGIGVAYTVGLLHDLPEILLRQAFPSQFEAAMDFAAQASRPVRALLPDVFSVSIYDVAAELVSNLKLPPVIANPLREYAAASEVVDGNFGPMVDRLTMALVFSDYYANALQLATSPDTALIAPVTLSDCRTAYVASAQIDGPDIRTKTLASIGKSGGDAKGDSPPAVDTPARLKIWYARDANFAELDPVEEALRQLGDVETHQELPGKSDQSLDCVVLCASSTERLAAQWPARHPNRDGADRPKFLHILPIGSHPQRDDNAAVTTLYYPFTLPALREVAKSCARPE